GRGYFNLYGAPFYIYGNVSGTGTLNITDAQMILRHLVGKLHLTEEQQDIADVDGDRSVTVSDARLILQKLTGKIADFPRVNLEIRN
ncbi:MAG: dockerin type I repeat-containing protein, partial [Oscillospiraceae bacterium]|nr:dockerin type I repeat-containing protein [Oscillospiraceae bacterium]